MAIEWIIANKEVLKLIYAFFVLFVCMLIFLKADRLFKISDYQGIRYFRNSFFFFGLAVIARFILGLVTTTNPMIYSMITKILFEMFTIIASLFLIYSLIWKRVEKQKKYHSLFNASAFIFYLISIIIVGLEYASKNYILFYLFQILLFLLILIVAFKNYLTFGKNYSFQKIYLFATFIGLISWLLEIILYLGVENRLIQIAIYTLNLLFFFLFLNGVINLTKNGKKRDRLEIIKDILEAIHNNRNIKPTRLLHISNLSPQLFKEYIQELKDRNLIKEETISNKRYFVPTTKGIDFLEEYKTFSLFIKNFGL